MRKMVRDLRRFPKGIIILLNLLLFSSHLSSSQEISFIIKNADLNLDMMEYETAIGLYQTALSKNPKQRDIQKRIGYAFFQLNNYDDALQSINKELENYPDNDDAYNLLIYILLCLDQLVEADDFLVRHGFSVSLTENNPHIGGLGCFILGMHFKKIKEFDKANRYFKKALQHKYDPVKCYIQLTDLKGLQDGPEYAYRAVREAGKKCGEQPEFFCMTGILFDALSHKDIGFRPLVSMGFKKSIELKPDFWEAVFNLACVYYNSQDFKQAAEYFRKLLEIEPDDSTIRFYLDCCLAHLGKKVQTSLQCPAKIQLTKYFVDQPDMEYICPLKRDVDFVINKIGDLALGLIKIGNIDAAIKRYHNALKIYPEHPVINHNLGLLYVHKKNYGEAEKHALLALRKKGFFDTIPDIYMNRPLSDQKKEGLLKKVIVSKHVSPDIPISRWTLDVALKEGNYYLEAYDLLGNIYFSKGEYEKSVLAFHKVIELREKDTQGHYNLGCAYKALHNWEKAEEEWRKALEYEQKLEESQEPEKISGDVTKVSVVVKERSILFRTHKALGRLYLEQNARDKALEEFTAAIQLEPGDPESYFEAGKIYQLKGDIDKAVFCYEKYLYLGGKEEKKAKELLRSLTDKK
ncbi:MAG: tetratricopeptide repeat protein [Candidatus Aminicenantales bacterium]